MKRHFVIGILRTLFFDSLQLAEKGWKDIGPYFIDPEDRIKIFTYLRGNKEFVFSCEYGFKANIINKSIYLTQHFGWEKNQIILSTRPSGHHIAKGFEQLRQI